MAKLPNIIQRRELEPLMLKACKIIKHYEKAANCAAVVMGPNNEACSVLFCSKCRECKEQENCCKVHLEAVNEAKLLGGSYIYTCPRGNIFWTSPFYSGERFAGAFLSGGIASTEENNKRAKALANMLLLCAYQISSLSYVQKNIGVNYVPVLSENDKLVNETQSIYGDSFSAEMERLLLANLRRGDTTEAKKILQKLLYNHCDEQKDCLPAHRLKAMELAVLLSRAAADHGELKDNVSFEKKIFYMEKIEESTNLQEIEKILFTITEKMSAKIFSFQGVRHFSALRKAERFIWNNYTRKLSLSEISKACGLSAPYFSTIFKEEMGENLSNYLNRLRVEKAASMLTATNMPISEISVSCGFEDQSWFSKIFKNFTGLTPGKYREHPVLAEEIFHLEPIKEVVHERT